MALQYIGVTGFKSREQIFDVHARSGIHTSDGTQKEKMSSTPHMMCGVLVSKKTFFKNDFSGSMSSRYVTRDELRKIFYEHPDLVNLVHYNSDSSEKELSEELFDIMIVADGAEGGSNCSGFQLNLKYVPSLKLFDRIQEVYQHNLIFVLQINSRILTQFDEDPVKLAQHLKSYSIQSSFLLDLSGGTGKSLDVELLRPYVDAFAQVGVTIGMGVAGGLSAEAADSLTRLIERYPYLSIDAEGKLHDSGQNGGMFNPEKAKRYVNTAVQLFERYR